MPDDGVVNTLHVLDNALTPDFDAWVDAWDAFMSSQVAAFPEQVAQHGHTFKVYSLSDPEPRAPVHEATWSLPSAPTGETLPTEVAFTLSYEGARISGQDQRRRRGRVFLGPFNLPMTEGGRPAGTFPADVVGAFISNWIQAVNTAGGLFVVYSRADQQGVTVRKVWADNAWDTQRSRGQVATSRSYQNITQ